MFRTDNKNVYELTEKAQKLFEADDFAGALEAINRAISILPRNVDLHDFKSDILFHSGDFDETIKELEFIETLDPGDASHYSMESLCYLQMGEDEKALELADKAIKVDNDYEFSYYNRARALNNLGRTEDAISAYRLYLEKEPSDPDGHRDLGELYLDAGNYKMAERELKLSLRFRKNDKITNDLMVELKLATGGAFEFTRALLDAFKNTADTDYLVRITDFLLDNGDMDNAEKIAKDFYNSALDNLDMASNLAKVYYIEQKYDMGNGIFKEYIKRNNNIEANEEYVKMLVTTAQYDLALSIIEENARKYPEEETFIFYKFYALSEKGEHADALLPIKTLYDKQPDSIQYGINYAIELSHNGVKDEPVDILNRISKLDKGPEIERAYYTVYGNLGLYDKAVEYLGRAVEMDDDIEEICDILNPAIEDSITKNYHEKIIQLLNTLPDKEENIIHALYAIEKACILSAVNRTEEATKILEGIDSKEDVCMIINQYMDFENSKISEFLEDYFNKHCNNLN